MCDIYIVNIMMHAIRLLDGYIITIMMHAVRVYAVNNVNGIKQGERTDLIDIINKVGAKRRARATHISSE